VVTYAVKRDIHDIGKDLVWMRLEMKTVIDSLQSRGLRRKVKVMVGGAPLDAVFAGEIEADGCGKDAVEAVRLERCLVLEE
jgi:methanogenic corrinoid protein MtbC1